MGNVTLPVGATDKRVTEYLRAYFESERKRFGITQRSNLTEQKTARDAGILEASSLARAIGENGAWISRRMSGLIGWTQTDLDKIAKALGVSDDELRAGAQEREGVMSACETCWERAWKRAQRDVMLLGGSVVDHYERHINTDKDHERVPTRDPQKAKAS